MEFKQCEFSSLVAMFGLRTVQVDVKNAFVNAKGNEWFFLELPMLHPEKEGRNKIWRTKSAIYGRKDAPRLWNSLFHDVLLQLDFKNMECAPCLYVNEEASIIMALYVDDVFIAAKEEQVLKKLVQKINGIQAM